MPEARLAREAEMAYATLALATDWDCWHPHQACVTAEMAIANLQGNARRAQQVLAHAVRRIEASWPVSAAHSALGSALVTPPAAMSAPVRERLLRLGEAGVIKGWRVELDPKALGFPITILVRVRPMPGQLPKIAKLAQSIPQVTECHRITGEDCFLLRAHLRALDELDGLLDRFLAYGQTTTSILQSSPVPPRPLPLPGA